MNFEIGPITSSPGVAPTRRVDPAGAPGFQATLDAVGRTSPTTDVAQIAIPGSPPPEVVDAIGAAADQADSMAAANRELHFERDPESGRVIVQVRDLTTREVIRTIPPSEALTVMSGGTF
jgi:hypothetical protein